MIPDSADSLSTEQHPLLRWTMVITVAVVASVLMLGLFSGRIGFRDGGLSPGTPAPEIQAAGWLNGPALSPDDLKGKVIVIDGWASWCGPCRAAAPHMIEVYNKYHDRVVFLGLTNEEAADLSEIEDFLRDTGIPWPNGYGAGETLDKLGMKWVPSIWIIGRDGAIAWHGTNPEPRVLEAAIERALDEK